MISALCPNEIETLPLRRFLEDADDVFRPTTHRTHVEKSQLPTALSYYLLRKVVADYSISSGFIYRYRPAEDADFLPT